MSTDSKQAGLHDDADGTDWQGRSIHNSSIGGSELGTPSRSTGPRRESTTKEGAHDLVCFARRRTAAVAAAAAAADDDEVSFTDEGDDDDEEYPPDSQLAPCTRAVHECHLHDFAHTQQTLMQKTETEPGDANLSTHTRVLEKTIALVNPAKSNGVEKEEEDGDDLARPVAGDADAAAVLPAHSELALSGNARLHSLHEQGRVLQQRRLIEARARYQKPWAAGAMKKAYTASDRITRLYEQGRAQLQKAARFARDVVRLSSGSAVSRAAQRHRQNAIARSKRPPPPPPKTPKPGGGGNTSGDAGHGKAEPPTRARLLELYQSGVRVQSARRHASSDQGMQGAAHRARSAKSLPPAMMPSDAECTFAPKLATDYTLLSQVRTAQSSSDRRSVG